MVLSVYVSYFEKRVSRERAFDHASFIRSSWLIHQQKCNQRLGVFWLRTTSPLGDLQHKSSSECVQHFSADCCHFCHILVYMPSGLWHPARSIKTSAIQQKNPNYDMVILLLHSIEHGIGNLDKSPTDKSTIVLILNRIFLRISYRLTIMTRKSLWARWKQWLRLNCKLLVSLSLL